MEHTAPSPSHPLWNAVRDELPFTTRDVLSTIVSIVFFQLAFISLVVERRERREEAVLLLCVHVHVWLLGATHLLAGKSLY